MKRGVRRTVIVFVLSLFAALAFSGGAVATSDSGVDFEDPAHDDALITDQFAYQGVTFGSAAASGVSFDADCGAPTQRDNSLGHNASRSAVAGRCLGNEFGKTGTYAAFSFPHRSVSVWLGSDDLASHTARMTVYGSGATALESRDVTVGSGAGWNVSVARGQADITGVSFELVGFVTGGVHLVLDDLVFDNSAAPLDTQGRTVSASPGQAFSGLVGHFFDHDPTAQPGDFNASIEWGDGSASLGSVLSVPGNGYDISGSHTWAATGTYTLTITLRKPAYDRTTTFTSTTNVTAGGGGSGTGTGGGAGGGGGGGSSTRPIAEFTVGVSATLGRATWLSAATSSAPSDAQIVRYDWNFDGNNPRFDPRIGACGGGLPAVSHPFQRAGSHEVGLRVTDSQGRNAEVLRTITVSRADINQASHSAEVFDCENPGANNQPDRADCVKTIAFGIVEVNSRGRGEDCFKISSYAPERRGPALGATGGSRSPLRALSLDYHATVEGPVSLNGLYLPLPPGAGSEYDSRDSAINVPSIPIWFGKYRTKVAELTRQTITPDRHGVYHLADLPLSGVVKLFGLHADAGVSFDLIKHASLTTIKLGLPDVFTITGGRKAQGSVQLYSDNLTGTDLNGVTVRTGAVLLGPVTLSGLYFKYDKLQDVLEGGASLSLPGGLVTLEGSPPPPDWGFGLRNGQFDHAGAGVRLEGAARPQLFPGVFLTHLGVGIGVNPTRFTGQAGISVANVIDIDGTTFVAFATPRKPYDFPTENVGDELAPLAGRLLDSTTVAVGGTGALKVPFLGPIKAFGTHVLYIYPDYAEVGGHFHFGVPVKTGGDDVFTVDGGFNGFVQASAKPLYDFGVDAEACIHVIIDGCAPKAGGAVSNNGIGFCGYFTIPVPYVPFATLVVYGGLGYHWGDSLPKVMVYSCDYDSYKQASPRAAQASDTQRSVTLPPGLPSAMIKITGQDGAPVVTLTGPRDERITPPDSSGNATGPNYLVLPDSHAATTLIALKRPSGGRWTITPEAGSVPITGLATANGLPAPRVRASVSGRGRTRTLSYSFASASGRVVTFAERGARTYRILGKGRTSGRIRFTPGYGGAGRREIEALVQEDGAPSHTVVVASYRAPAPPLPARPRGIHVTHRGATLNVRWSPVRGATGYEVAVLLSDGQRSMVLPRRPRSRITSVRPSLRGTVIVVAERADGVGGPEGRGRIPAAARRRRR